jgi:translation initiation factor IF-2
MIRSARSGVLVVLVLVAVTVGVAACGGSSSPAAATFPGHHAGFAQRFASIRSCLEKHGVTLGTFGHGGGRPGTGHFRRPGAGFTPNAKFQAAMKACGAGFGGGGFGGGYPGGGGGYPGAGGGAPNGGPAN